MVFRSVFLSTLAPRCPAAAHPAHLIPGCDVSGVRIVWEWFFSRFFHPSYPLFDDALLPIHPAHTTHPTLAAMASPAAPAAPAPLPPYMAEATFTPNMPKRGYGARLRSLVQSSGYGPTSSASATSRRGAGAGNTTSGPSPASGRRYTFFCHSLLDRFILAQLCIILPCTWNSCCHTRFLFSRPWTPHMVGAAPCAWRKAGVKHRLEHRFKHIDAAQGGQVGVGVVLHFFHDARGR